MLNSTQPEVEVSGSGCDRFSVSWCGSVQALLAHFWLAQSVSAEQAFPASAAFMPPTRMVKPTLELLALAQKCIVVAPGATTRPLSEPQFCSTVCQSTPAQPSAPGAVSAE